MAIAERLGSVNPSMVWEVVDMPIGATDNEPRRNN